MGGFDIISRLRWCCWLFSRCLPASRRWPAGVGLDHRDGSGKYTRTTGAGAQSHHPLFRPRRRKMNMMEQVINIHRAGSDHPRTTPPLTSGRCRVLPGVRCRESELRGFPDLNQAIIVLTMTNIRSVMGSMDLDQVSVASRRDQ